MSRMTVWLLCLGASIGIAAISVVGTRVWVISAQYTKPKVPLTAGLEGGWAAMSNEFDRRVKNSFPVGSLEKLMAAELQRQGFSREDWHSSTEQESEAARREDTWMCIQAARIYWRADSEGRLTTIRALYREEGCL
jgi:hypothetical protein